MSKEQEISSLAWSLSVHRPRLHTLSPEQAQNYLHQQFSKSEIELMQQASEENKALASKQNAE